MKNFLFVLSLLLFQSSSAIAINAAPQYAATFIKDFIADAPWRVKGIDKAIPFAFFIKDADQNSLECLQNAEILVQKDGTWNRIYFYDFGCMTINDPLWIWPLAGGPITKFQNADGPFAALNGKPLTPENLGFAQGDIEFEVRLAIDYAIDFSQKLRVHVGEKFPRPDDNWLYGDAHYHTQYTDNPYESGGELNLVKESLEAIDLDWITTTDHASNSFGWDLNAARWEELRSSISSKNNPDSGLPFIIGEEITCQPKDNVQENGIHLLVYNNDRFIPGTVDDLNNATLTLESRLGELNATALGYAAHPSDLVTVPAFGDIVQWEDSNYNIALTFKNFYGLEVWNTRTTMYSEGCTSDNIDPFTGREGWEYPYKDDDRGNHFLPNLRSSIYAWDKLLKNHLNPIRKILVNAGSDAHGDMNYTTYVDLAELDLLKCKDNALGKVRTLVYARERSSSSVLEGLRNGHSIITDGPVLLIGIDNNKDQKLNKLDGDFIVGDIVDLKKGDDIDIVISWIAYENREIEYIDLFLDGIMIKSFDLQNYREVNGNALEGNLPYTIPMTLTQGGHYIRAECQTKIFKNNSGFEDCYRAYTNPLWLYSSAEESPSLTVSKSGTGSGTVTSTPPGISCGQTCKAYFTSGTSVTLTASADAGSTFTGWSGGGCSGTGPCRVNLSSNTTVDASFALWADCAYTISLANKTFNPNGGSVSVKVGATGQTNCPAPLVVEDGEWISVSGASSWKANKGTIKIAVQKNQSSRNRTGVVSISGKDLTIEQRGAICQLTALKPSSGKYPNTGGSGSFDIMVSPQDCGWNAATTFDWIHLDTTTGTGSGTAAFHLDANSTGKTRTGKIGVSLSQKATKKKTFTVNESK